MQSGVMEGGDRAEIEEGGWGDTRRRRWRMRRGTQQLEDKLSSERQLWQSMSGAKCGSTATSEFLHGLRRFIGHQSHMSVELTLMSYAAMSMSLSIY